jgi:hypothetical protein
MSLILKMFDNKYLKANNLIELQKRIKATLTSESNMRTLRLMQTIKTETDTRCEYFDADVGSDSRLFYQEEMEEDMISYEEEIRTAISKIIKELSEEEGIDTD